MSVPCPISGYKVTNCKLNIFNFLNKKFHKINIIKQNNVYLQKFFVLNTYTHLTHSPVFLSFPYDTQLISIKILLIQTCW